MNLSAIIPLTGSPEQRLTRLEIMVLILWGLYGFKFIGGMF